MAVGHNIFERVAEVLKENQSIAYENNPSSTKYFQVSHSTERHQIGSKYPQIKEIDLPIAHSLQHHELPEFPLSFGKISLHKSSKLTDLISTAAISAHAFILSEKAIEVFQQFDLGHYKIHPAAVVYRGNTFKYGVLHFLNDLQARLNFGVSTFYVANLLGGYEFDIDINSAEEYEQTRSEVKQGIWPGTKKWWYVRLKDGTFLPNSLVPDLFTIFSSGTYPYISTRLAEAIIEKGLTGFNIERVYNLRD